jgi:GGDEF domain-containing protein
MTPATPRRRRARPVADAPLDHLLPRVEELTKGWLLALLEQAPLDDAPAILAADLTRDGPRLCDAALRALADESDMRRLETGGSLRPLAARAGELAGATGPAAAARAVDALQAILWAAIRQELRGPDPDLVFDLGERLALIAELLRGAALEAVAGGPDSAGPAGGGRGLSAVPAVGGGPGVAGPGVAGPASAPVVAFDRSGYQGGGADPVEPEEPDALWIGALEDEIRRALAADAPLSLLLAELDDVERMTAADTPDGARAAFGRFARAVRGAVRRQEILACETDSRAWIIAPDTARAGARALGERIAAAVGQAEGWRGAPLAASIGVAVLGDDGTRTGDLIAAAEDARFAAEAGGVEMMPACTEPES